MVNELQKADSTKYRIRPFSFIHKNNVAVAANTRNTTIVKNQFHDLCKTSFAMQQKHPPIPHGIADIGAGFIVGPDIRKFEIFPVRTDYTTFYARADKRQGH